MRHSKTSKRHATQSQNPVMQFGELQSVVEGPLMLERPEFTISARKSAEFHAVRAAFGAKHRVGQQGAHGASTELAEEPIASNRHRRSGHEAGALHEAQGNPSHIRALGVRPQSTSAHLRSLRKTWCLGK